MDISAIFMIEEIINKLEEKNIRVILLLRHADKRKVLNVDTSNTFKMTKYIIILMLQ